MGIDPSLSPAEARDLHRIAGIMIPADPAFGVPAANDPAILADILQSLGRDLPDVRSALTALADQHFGDLNDADAEALALAFLAIPTKPAAALSRAVLQCYYRDDRVLTSIGHEPRAPFPKGHTVEQGDWSLLDVVKNRPQLWRDDRRP